MGKETGTKANPAPEAPRPVHVAFAGRSPGLRMSEVGLWRSPCLPGDDAPVAVGDLSGHGRGGGCVSRKVASRIAFPFHLSYDRHQQIAHGRSQPAMSSDRCLLSDDVNTRHAEKMKKIKAARDRMMETKTEEKGLIIVNTGKGKGKSSSGFGMVFRAIAHGMPCAVVQFIKGSRATGERSLLEDRFADICQFVVSGEGFTWETQDRERDIAAAQAGWEKAKDFIRDHNIKFVLLDEINIALRNDYLDIDEVVDFLLTEKPDMTHVCLTGRNAKPELIEAADLVSEMELVKHPFRDGIKAQAGVEF